MKKTSLIILCLLVSIASIYAQENINTNKFRQLGQELPTPNVYRTASGAPGHAYWQQKADYKIKLELNDENQRIDGSETITYHNNSPDGLDYLWVQLDQNVRAKDSNTYKTRTLELDDKMTPEQLARVFPTFEGGFKIEKVSAGGKNLAYTIVKTMMRIDLPQTLESGESYTFDINWWYNINDRFRRDIPGGRSGYEYFPEDDNYLYCIAQFFPRMAVYIDNEGWQNKQFLGNGEFTLTFGDYEFELTVPADHYVAATGELQNADEVLSEKERKQWKKAQSSYDDTVIIVTEKDARKNEKTKSDKKKTWKFKATNVRDFAFATSRKFIWDAMAVKQADGTTVMAMSMYPKEGNPLWEQYSTKAVAHTLKWYSHYTFPYPYPVAWSIHQARIGMEYPMICFNYGRPEKDGTYSERTKYGMIGVIIHEVGHNYFPMIVNSDERQWTWMDEGLNTFVQYLTEQQWERNYPSRRGPAHLITPYMSGDKSRISPIMTNSESIFQFGNNAYGKPATALNILRETVMGRELFDYSFKTYANRWKFKHPTPADLFRTMEDASSVDLDWFWRGWFYTTDHVDIAISDVKAFRIDSKDPAMGSKTRKAERDAKREHIGTTRNKKIKQTQDEIDPKLVDFYTTYDPLDVSILDEQAYEEYLKDLSDVEKDLIAEGYNFYQVTFEMIGGLVMPIVVDLEFEDGTVETHRIPAEIWKMGADKVTKVFRTKKNVTSIVLDPYLELADTDTSNNYYPPRQELNRFEIFKQKSRTSGENPIQKAKRAKEAAKKAKE